MFSRLKDFLIALCTGLCLNAGVSAMPAASPDYALLSRSVVETLPVTFEQSQRHWLQARGELILGTSAPDYPPFDMTASGKDYEGLTADYAGLVSQATGLPVRVKRFLPARPRFARCSMVRLICWAPRTATKRVMPILRSRSPMPLTNPSS